MIAIREHSARGRAKIGWLDSRHTFSFGEYHDPEHMGFRALRVINEDRVVPGAGFPTHGHANMEIISYVLDGALEHKDSIGTGSVIRPGEIQRMSAGTGIRHSEFNASKGEPVHFLQIWILPGANGIAPSYEQKALPKANGASRLDLIGSPEGGEHAVTIHQDVKLYRALLAEQGSMKIELGPDRHAWIQVARGSGEVDGQAVREGDGVAISSHQGTVALRSQSGAEFLVFDLA